MASLSFSGPLLNICGLPTAGLPVSVQDVRVVLPGAEAPQTAGLPDLSLPPAAFAPDAFITGSRVAPLASYPASILRSLSIYAGPHTGGRPGSHALPLCMCCWRGVGLCSKQRRTGMARNCSAPFIFHVS